ncbi:MAG TPA: SpoIIE family protein phosphatase, partial [Bacteroidia bacterium]|nr:SpoIIE family protein phosphatase [Bacteroidia bacterium]
IFKEVFVNRTIMDPAALLHEIDRELFATLNKNHAVDPYKDGMDVALCRYDKLSGVLHYAGAFRPLIVVKKGNIHEIAACRYPIGFYDHADKFFSTRQIRLEKGDTCYIYSDGYADQFGGEKGKKLNKPRFLDLLLTVQEMTMDEQRDFLDYAHNNWKQKEEQTDDIAVIGFSV